MFGNLDSADLFWGIVLLVAMAGIIFLVLRYVDGNEGLKSDKDPETGKHREPKLCRGGWREAKLRRCDLGYKQTGIPVEPINTYTNLAYLAAGWVAFRSVGGGPALIFLIAMTFLCFGSAIYHGVKTRWSARWDHGGMYSVVAGLTFYVIVVGHPADTWIMLAGAGLSGAILAWLLDGRLMARMVLLMALISAGVLSRDSAMLGVYSLVLFAVAMLCWLIDTKTKVLRRFGHGLWHLFTAAALAVMFAAVVPPAV